MTDVSNLDELANAISSKSPAIKKYAQAQAAATQSQETAIRDLDARVTALEQSEPEPEPPLPPPLLKPFAEASYEGYADVPNVPLWSKHGEHAKATDRLTIVDDPLGKRGKVMRVEIRSGDNNVTGSGNNGERAEVMCGGESVPIKEGGILSVRIGLMVPAGFRSNASDWNIPMQTHDAGAVQGQSPIQWKLINDGQLGVRLLGGPLASSGGEGNFRADLGPWPLTKDAWHEIVWAVRLNSDPAKGWIKVAIDDKVVADRACANIYQGHESYWKQGFYRVAQPYTSILYFDTTSFYTAPTIEEAFAGAL